MVLSQKPTLSVRQLIFLHTIFNIRTTQFVTYLSMVLFAVHSSHILCSFSSFDFSPITNLSNEVSMMHVHFNSTFVEITGGSVETFA